MQHKIPDFETMHCHEYMDNVTNAQDVSGRTQFCIRNPFSSGYANCCLKSQAPPVSCSAFPVYPQLRTHSKFVNLKQIFTPSRPPRSLFADLLLQDKVLCTSLTFVRVPSPLDVKHRVGFRISFAFGVSGSLDVEHRISFRISLTFVGVSSAFDVEHWIGLSFGLALVRVSGSLDVVHWIGLGASSATRDASRERISERTSVGAAVGTAAASTEPARRRMDVNFILIILGRGNGLKDKGRLFDSSAKVMRLILSFTVELNMG